MARNVGVVRMKTIIEVRALQTGWVRFFKYSSDQRDKLDYN